MSNLNGYVVIYMESEKPLTNKERKKYVDSLSGDYYVRKRGTITKFNNAMGFKPVIDDMYTEYPEVKRAEVESPEGYVSPEDLLFNSLQVDFRKKGIVKFEIPIETYVHTKSRFTYKTRTLIEKFIPYLYKVYPEVKIRTEFKERLRHELKTWVLSYVLKNIDVNSTVISVECSLPRRLSRKERTDLNKSINEVTNYPCHIYEYYCPTCCEHNNDTPFHMEIVYEEKKVF